MVDRLTKDRRSENMRRIRAKNTTPELVVRRLAHSLGYRYRLHCKNLPGKPDLVFASRKKIIFVHGCFWHLHDGCRRATVPKSRKEYWVPKLQRNKQNDQIALTKLALEGWHCLVIWECELSDLNLLSDRLTAFLGLASTTSSTMLLGRDCLAD